MVLKGKEYAPATCLLSQSCIQVEDGSDMFLSLTGSYVKSSWLGLPLDRVPLAQETNAKAVSLNGVPRPIAALLVTLGTPQAISTPGLFIDSIQALLDRPVTGWSSSSRSTQRALLRRLSPVVEALEQGGPVPPETAPHEAAAMLLVTLAELPRALLHPAAVALVGAAVEADQVRLSALFC